MQSDWHPGRVTQQYRAHYDRIFGPKENGHWQKESSNELFCTCCVEDANLISVASMGTSMGTPDAK